MGNRNTDISVIIVVLLLRGDVEANSKDDGGRTPLKWAAEKGRRFIVEDLLKRADTKTDQRDVTGRTPLWQALLTRIKR
jgi:ankyrin repeat protein